MIFNVFTSTVDLAVFVALFNIVKLAIIPTVAISEANVPLSAYFYGANKFDSIKKLVFFELKMAIGISVIIWLVLVVLNGAIAQLYGTSLLFVDKFIVVLPVYTFILIFMPLGNIGVSLLQSLQKYNISLILTFFKSIILELILSAIGFFVFSSVFGIYLGLITGSIIGCVIVLAISFRIFNKTKEKYLLESGGSVSKS